MIVTRREEVSAAEVADPILRLLIAGQVLTCLHVKVMSSMSAQAAWRLTATRLKELGATGDLTRYIVRSERAPTPAGKWVRCWKAGPKLAEIVEAMRA